MAKNFDTQIDRKKRSKEIPLGVEVEENDENVRNFKKWFNLTSKEQLISF